ncbi:hypothetical protein ACJMK2_031465 [Sinanodonta woodiana]|uniref:Uncharacterized protein n=1 Tax=Sinanodonta woodiana TaxID=1069815 RepID=A0ABD3WYV5_SINWO
MQDVMDIVASFDVGSTYSGYAYSTRTEYMEDMLQIHLNDEWISGHGNLHTYKTPSHLLLTADRQFHSFGYEAERKYAQLIEAKSHDTWYFFRHLKKDLKNKNLRKDTMVEEEAGKSMSFSTILTIVYKYLRQHLLRTIDVAVKSASSESLAANFRIEYILTVPTKWITVSREMTITAAKMAGLTHCRVITESEAVGRYCQLHPLTSGKSGSIHVLKPGMRHVIVNIGGFGVDTTVQDAPENEPVKEFSKSHGDANGGVRVDEEFMKLITKVFGADIIGLFMKKHKIDLIDLQQEFEVRKRRFTLDAAYDTTDLHLPPSLLKLYLTKSKERLQDRIDDTDLVGKIIAKDDRLIIDKSIMKDLFGPSIKSIISYLSSIAKDPEVRQTDAIILTGGFSQSSVLEGAVRFYFPTAKIVIPPNADLAVLLGGVLIGHNPDPVVVLTAKYTYGFGIALPFNKNRHPKEKMFISSGKEFCTDVFQTQIRLGQMIELGRMSNPHHLFPNRAKQTIMSIPVYASSKANPRFTTDQGVFYLGRLTVNLNKSYSDSRIRVQMTLLASTLLVEGVDEASGDVSQAVFATNLSRPSSY